MGHGRLGDAEVFGDLLLGAVLSFACIGDALAKFLTEDVLILGFHGGPARCDSHEDKLRFCVIELDNILDLNILQRNYFIQKPP